MLGVTRDNLTHIQKLEAITHWLDGITGSHVYYGEPQAGGDEGVGRFDFTDDISPAVANTVEQETGWKAKVWGNSLWIHKGDRP